MGTVSLLWTSRPFDTPPLSFECGCDPFESLNFVPKSSQQFFRPTRSGEVV